MNHLGAIAYHNKLINTFREYNISVDIYDEDEHRIYPSNNILTKTAFGKQFEVIEVNTEQHCYLILFCFLYIHEQMCSGSPFLLYVG